MSAHRGTGRPHHNDSDFQLRTAMGELTDPYEFARVREMKSSENHRDGTTTKVFADGVSANDIRQGALGDCYLLSAISIIAHSRPELIKKIFHPDSRTYTDEGMYSVMLYNGKVPTIITIDD